MFKKKTVIIFSGFALVVICFVINFNKQMALEKANYETNLKQRLDEYLQQNRAILQSLSKNLIVPIKQNNLANIVENLRAYEEVLFALAKHGLVIPLNLQLVSLDAPQQIIGSIGILDGGSLAADDDYYIQVVDQPRSLNLSKLYIKQEMPDYLMLNLGISVTDTAHDYHRHIDAKLAVNSLIEYLEARLPNNAKLFSFKFTTGGSVLQPQIFLLKNSYWLLLLKYIAMRLSILSAVGVGIYLASKLYAKIVNKQNELLTTRQELQLLTQEVANNKIAVEVQDAYGILASNFSDALQIIEVQQLLADVKAVNINFAIASGVKLVFPEYNSKHLSFYGQKLRVMQILSGILYEIIRQNSPGGVVELKVMLSDYGQQQIKFVFSDNGFYNALQDRDHRSSVADVRCKGWSNILQLIDLDSGALEHVHTAYVGNTITFTTVKKLVNNVINLETYCQQS